jgi:ATP-dependent Clp endopeptidase proteolytic subunit ClpP
MKWYELKAFANKAELRIFGEIGWEVLASDLIAKLDALGDIDLDVRINSVGGSVIEGMHIYNRLRLHKGGVEVTIEGIAASMATVIACAGKTVRMMDAGWFMVHDPSGMSWGTAEDMRKAAEVLDKMRDTIVDVYVARTGKDRAEVETMMDDETWMNPEEAKAHGFIDEIVEIDMQIAAQLGTVDLSKFRRPPALSNSGSAGIHGLESGQPKVAAPAASNPGVNMTPEEIAAMKAAALKEGQEAEAARRAAVRAVFAGISGFDLAAVSDKCVEDVTCTAEIARERLLAEIKAQNDRTVEPHRAVHVTRDARDKARDGMQKAQNPR